MVKRKHLGVPTRASIEEYRLWKLEGDSPGKMIKRLISASKTYLASSNEYKCSFQPWVILLTRGELPEGQKPFFCPVSRRQWPSSRAVWPKIVCALLAERWPSAVNCNQDRKASTDKTRQTTVVCSRWKSYALTHSSTDIAWYWILPSFCYCLKS